MPYNKKEAKEKKKRQEWEDHTERRLRDNYDVFSKELNKSYEGLLAEDRSDKKRETTTEGQLEGDRPGTRHAITEKLMDTEKPSFGNVMRKALETGELPPLEAQRLEGDTMESEKYERAHQKGKSKKEK